MTYSEMASDLVRELMREHARRLEAVIAATKVCMRCRVAPMEVIAHAPTFTVSMVDDAVGAPTSLRIEETVSLLCASCAAEIR